ncbi:DUF4253 domain-containing protein [Actinoplanes sp. LDG1-06]|uniref:DUF4253 domain-containing protein n=1 Tax=Paractinoplanes ovalisporus TaxID=2810368 RepID=A0ABS2A2I1_9ACTN|nr:DUF4253 domain-containing protein [Actinoplanes ovalisporus]MBM2614051.1 DUF4253 domain-containing protein [Actinoplanes ovalisporus]
MGGSSEGVRGLAALSTLPVELPRGRLVHGDEGSDEQPAMWVSESPVSAEVWAALRQAHRFSGLWPLLLDTLRGETRRPWDDGELWPASMGRPSEFDPEELLADWWDAYADGDDPWPGLADAVPVTQDQGAHADRCATALLADKPSLRLGLVAADRPSDAITVAGWQGAVNYTNDTAELSAVLRSWKSRFGAAVIGAGFADLYVSVAAPPGTLEEALYVAAEHFAFCPDNVWQGGSPSDLAGYAERLIDAPIWSFRWD